MFVERFNSKQNRICSARIAWKVRCQIRSFFMHCLMTSRKPFFGGNFKHQYLPHYGIFLGKKLQTWSVEPSEHFGISFGYIPRLFQSWVSSFNPPPDTVFRHLRSDRGGGVRPPLGVFKRSVVEIRGKDQQIVLAEYSRLVYFFWSHVNIWPSYGRSKVKFSEIILVFKVTSPYQQNYLS